MNNAPAPSLLLVVLSLLSLALQADAAALRALVETTGSHATADAVTKTEGHGAKVESPSTVSFTGPLIAGALAIVLIGAVVKFRARQSATQ